MKHWTTKGLVVGSSLAKAPISQGRGCIVDGIEPITPNERHRVRKYTSPSGRRKPNPFGFELYPLDENARIHLHHVGGVIELPKGSRNLLVVVDTFKRLVRLHAKERTKLVERCYFPLSRCDDPSHFDDPEWFWYMLSFENACRVINPTFQDRRKLCIVKSSIAAPLEIAELSSLRRFTFLSSKYVHHGMHIVWGEFRELFTF